MSFVCFHVHEWENKQRNFLSEENVEKAVDVHSDQVERIFEQRMNSYTLREALHK